MTALTKFKLTFIGLLLILFFLSGCGENGDGANEVTIAITAQPDALDPALSAKAEDTEPMWVVYTPLITYQHAEGLAGTKLIPGLARSLPEISADGKTYKLNLRKGLVYSNGVPVQASDFEHQMKRVFAMGSSGISFFSNIVGSDDFVKKGDPNAPLEGIQTNDATGEITIKLTQPTATFTYALATTYAGLVPSTTPFKNMTTNPPPGVGAFKITKSTPNQGFVLERNDRFNVPGIPRAKLSKINVDIVSNPEIQAEQVIENKLDYMQPPPPNDLLPIIKKDYANRYQQLPFNDTHFLFLNQRTFPLNNQSVREAVNMAIQPSALTRIYGGLLIPSCNFLPPLMIGYKKIDPCPYPYNLEKAKQLVEQAGAKGAQVKVWVDTEEPYPNLGEYVADQLEEIGLNSTPEIVDSSIYVQTVGNQSTRAQIGWIGWFQDFPHPEDFFQILSAKAIQPTGNLNFGNVNDPVLTNEITRLSTISNLPSVADEWAKLDQRVIEKAYIVPLGNQAHTTFMSDKMNFQRCAIIHPVYQNDYSLWCLK